MKTTASVKETQAEPSMEDILSSIRHIISGGPSAATNPPSSALSDLEDHEDRHVIDLIHQLQDDGSVIEVRPYSAHPHSIYPIQGAANVESDGSSEARLQQNVTENGDRTTPQHRAEDEIKIEPDSQAEILTVSTDEIPAEPPLDDDVDGNESWTERDDSTPQEDGEISSHIPLRKLEDADLRDAEEISMFEGVETSTDEENIEQSAEENEIRPAVSKTATAAGVDDVYAAENSVASSGVDSGLLSEAALEEASAALDVLANLSGRRTPLTSPVDTKTVGQKTVDGLMRDLLTPLLKEWLDANLPSIVRTVVNEQVQKIVRQRIEADHERAAS